MYGLFLIQADKISFEMTNNWSEFSIRQCEEKKHPESIRDKLCVEAKGRL